jgi:DNA-binding CsgD family transcriptional regulator
MGDSPPTLEELILKIHAAPLQPDLWQSVIRDVLGSVRAQSGVLLTPNPKTPQDFWCVSANLDGSTLQQYARDFVADDLWLQGAIRTNRIAPGTISLDDQLVDRDVFRNSAFFNDFLRLHDIDRFMGACLGSRRTGDGLPQVMFSLVRGVGCEPFSLDDAKKLGRLIPHLVVACDNFARSQALALQMAIQRQQLDHVSAAIFAIDQTGRILLTNSTADSILREGNLLRSAGGRLAPGKQLTDDRTLADVLRLLRTGIGSSVLLTEAYRGRQTPCRATPVSATHHQWPCSHVIGMIWLVPMTTSTEAVPLLSRLFELTPAETRLLRAIARGDELRDAAEQLRISVHTARSQLKSIFRKTGRRSQSQLMALLNRVTMIELE